MLNISWAISLLKVWWEEVWFSDVENELLKSKIKIKLRFIVKVHLAYPASLRALQSAFDEQGLLEEKIYGQFHCK